MNHELSKKGSQIYVVKVLTLVQFRILYKEEFRDLFTYLFRYFILG
jgi:hypothetical protein